MSASPQNTRRMAKAQKAFLGTSSRFWRFFSVAGATRVTPAYRGSRWLSAAILILFLIQLATGILLSLYYHPDPATAHDSTRFLVGRVPAGWLVRSLHAWAAELLLLGVLAHLILNCARRAYARPREAQWVVGIFLLLFVLAFRFTGRLLPWDTIAYESAYAGLDMLRHIPLLGDGAARWLMGGDAFGAKTLGRFYTTHALVLPWLFFGLTVLHIYLMRRHGLKRGAR